MKEIWKNVIGYESLYEISNQGHVRSLGNFEMPNGGKHPPKAISPVVHKQGYFVVRLYKNHKQKSLFVHRLIAQAFIPNPLNLKFVNHIDGNKQNNSISNLEWITASGNVNHAYVMGLNPLPISVILTRKSDGAKLKSYSTVNASQCIGKNKSYISKMARKGIFENELYRWEYA